MYRSLLQLTICLLLVNILPGQTIYSGVRISEADYEGAPHFVISTPAATWYYDQAGGGFSRLIDREGSDWIAFRHEPWDLYPASAAAAYRGIPNLVFGSTAAGAGHPGHQQCMSRQLDGQTILSSSQDGRWQWRWRFYEEYAELTMLQTDPNHPYWFLYEGLPGGVFDPARQYFGTDTGGPRREQPDYFRNVGLYEQWQWAYFGHQAANRILFIVQQEPDTLSDTFSYLGSTSAGIASNDGMIVFGFGRADGARPLLTQPHTFRLGWWEGPVKNKSDHRKVAQYLSNLLPAPDGMLCELLREPAAAVITDATPEFGWIFPAAGGAQTAYQIQVASSPEILAAGRPDLWDSGRVAGTQSQNISYAGQPLATRHSYWWRVRVWGANGSFSPYSLPQQFRTGDFDPSGDEWPGESQWVDVDWNIRVAENRQRADFQAIRPRQLRPTGPGRYFIDFGRAAFGTLSFTAETADEGEAVEIFLGERSTGNTTVNKEPGVSNIGYQLVRLPLQKGRHTYQVKIPSHRARYPHSQQLADFYPEVMPFRYVEMNGPAGFRPEEATQMALFYYFDDAASAFSCSDERLNRIWDLCKYTLKATPFLGLYADGNRERMPYEADAYIQQLGHYSVDREFSIARYTANFLLYHAAWPTEWQMHTLFMAWEDYLHTGNTDFLAAHYPALRAKTLLALAREDGLISTTTGKVTPEFLKSIHYNGAGFRDIVDWPAGTPAGQQQANNQGPTPEGERDGYIFTDINTVANAFHYRALLLMSRIAAAVGNEADRQYFSERSDKVRAAIQTRLFDPQRGVFVDGEGTDHTSLHANMFPLAFGLVAPEYLPTVIAHIKSRGMACSVYGAQYLLDGLYDAGEADYALKLMTSDSRRSWLNMLRVGSTMTTEAWDEYYKPNLTWNHAWGSAPANAITRKLLGVEPLEPGYARFRICPQPGALSEARLQLPTIRGTVKVGLTNEPQQWTLDVSIPGNSEAELWLPGRFDQVLVDGQPARLKESVVHGREKRWTVVLKSGEHRVEGSEK